MTPELLSRLVAKIDVQAPDECWEWTAGKLPRGYGIFHVGKQTRYAHRIVWEWFVGPIPAGLELDHLCRNPPCVNPDHLEPVTHLENVRRGEGGRRNGDRCRNGLHPWPESATTGRTKVVCLICERESSRRKHARARLNNT